jgi:hypothetical protein
MCLLLLLRCCGWWRLAACVLPYALFDLCLDQQWQWISLMGGQQQHCHLPCQQLAGTAGSSSWASQPAARRGRRRSVCLRRNLVASPYRLVSLQSTVRGRYWDRTGRYSQAAPGLAIRPLLHDTMVLPLAVLTVVAAAAGVTVTPWCANSVRVQVTDEAPDTPGVAARRSELRQALASEGLPELPGALINKCGPGAPAMLAESSPVTNGNIKVSASAGSIVVQAKDTGKTLFTAKITFTTPSPPPPPSPVPVPAGICAKAEPNTDQVGGKVIGSLRNKTVAECCAACVANPECDAWIQGQQRTPVGPNGCFFVSSPMGTKSATDRVVGFVRNSSRSGGGSAPIPGGFKSLEIAMSAGDPSERIYGLGQGNWTGLAGCASGRPQVVVPLERNGQTVELLQRKFHVTIPFVYSTAGYGFVFNMPGCE